MKKDYLIGPDVYKERHGHPFHRRRFHDCRMPGCKSKVDWDRSKLMTHFFRRHSNITMRLYYDGYVQRVSEVTILHCIPGRLLVKGGNWEGRDTVLVKPGSRSIFCSVCGSENHF